MTGRPGGHFAAPDNTLLSKARRVPARAVVTTVALLPVFVALFRLFAAPGDVVASGDVAITESAVRDASAFDRLLGPYSRFGWHHPGPLYFYLQAIPHWLFDRTESLYAVCLLTAPAVAAGVAVMIWRAHGAVAGMCVIGVTNMLALVLGLGFVQFPWSPHVLVFPAFGFMVWCGLAARSNVALYLAILSGSLIAQTHVSTVPVFAFGLLVAFVARIVFARRYRERLMPPSGIGAGLLLLAWLPVLIDQLTAREGNLSKIISYSSEAEVTHSWAEAMGRIGQSSWSPLNDSEVPSQSLWPLIVFGVLTVAAVFIGRRNPSVVITSATAVVGLVSATFTMRTTSGVLWHYLSVWVVAIPAALLVALAVAVFPQRQWELRARVPVLCVALATTMGLLLQTATAPSLPTDTLVSAFTSGLSTDPALRAAHSGVVRVDIRSGEAWAMAAGISNELERRGYRVDTRSGGQDDVFGFQSPPGLPQTTVEVWTTAELAGQERAGHTIEAGRFSAVVVA